MKNVTQRKASQERWGVRVSSDFLVLRYDPEYAQMDNPQGAVVGERFHLEATNEYGDRRVWGGFDTASDAEAALEFWAPPVFLWDESYPVYGSEAYVDYGEEEMQAWEARHQEWAGWFPGDRFARF
jgi:hypothetical protein